MSRGIVEVRDPLHVFVRLDEAEQAVLNSAAFQRLRSIHQLALSYLVYPSATHRRFEHSLGVMELATRIFDVVTNPKNVEHQAARDVIPEDGIRLMYWKRVLRMAALCHDLGHLPFSHAAEDELLPDGWDHEAISRAHILSDEMRAIWDAMEPPLRAEDIALLAVGPGEGQAMSPWQAVLGEMIAGDVFGADRIDYLLRDSLHTGVAYGRFDHFRLIDTLRILPSPPAGPGGAEIETDEPREPTLGIERGGIESAEALLLARYFMFSQVYFHRTRRIYDIHLKDFLKQWLDAGCFSVGVRDHLAMTDNEVLTEIARASREDGGRLGDLARRITEREHRFVVAYEPTPGDLARNADAALQVAAASRERYGDDAVREDRVGGRGGAFDFAVQMRDHHEVVSSTGVSEVLRRVPAARFDYVFLDRQHLADATSWLELEGDALIEPPAEEDEPEE